MEKPDYDGIKVMFKELLENNKGFLDMNFVGKIKMILKVKVKIVKKKIILKL